MLENGLCNGLCFPVQPGMRVGTVRGIANGLFSNNLKIYQPETIAWVNQLSSPKPSPFYIFEMDQLITSLKSASIWSQLDRLWIFATEQRTHAKISLVNPTGINTAWPSSITENGQLTWTKNKGYTGDGASAYLNTNYIPKNSKIVSGTNISWLLWSLTSVTEASAVEYGNNISGVEFTEGRVFNGSAGAFTVNANPGSSYTTSTGKGFWVASRVNGSQVTIYQNAIGSTFSQNYLGDSSGGTDNQAMYVLAWNRFAGNGPGNYSSQQLAMFGSGTGSINQPLLYQCIGLFMRKIGINA
jgi:hypothetical protein